MKVLVLLGLFVVAFLQADARSIANVRDAETPSILKEMFELGFVCGRELGAAKMKNMPNIAGLTQYPEDNDSLNALYGCVFNKKGIINENSEISDEGLRNYVNEIASMVGATNSHYQQAIDDMVETCRAVTGEDYGQKAVKIQNCIVRYSMERNLRK